MLQCNDIKHLKLFKMKCYLPFIDNTPTKDSCIIFNGMATTNVERIFKHKMLDNTRAKYRRLYIDRKIEKKIGGNIMHPVRDNFPARSAR